MSTTKTRMAGRDQPRMLNKLLAALPTADFEAVAPHLVKCALPRGTIVARPGKAIDYIHFTTCGVGSVIAVTSEGNRAEAGLFGFEGYIPAHAVAGNRTSPHEVVMQIAAASYKIEFNEFMILFDQNKSFRTVVLRAVAAFSVQLSFTAVSNALHGINERLARWLLMCHDRIPGDELYLTHDFISIMLAVRRPTVTTALHILEGNHLIRSERGLIIIRDRTAMEEFAKDAYGKPEEACRQLMETPL